MPPEDPAPTPASSDDRATDQAAGDAEPGVTRRSVLRRGAVGIGAASIGPAASNAASAASNATSAASTPPGGPPRPQHLRVDWLVDGEVGLRWDWDGVGCDNRLSHFAVEVSDGDAAATREVAPERDSVAVSLPGDGEHDVRAWAVDEIGRTSSRAALAVDATTSSSGALARPVFDWELAPGEEQYVPIEFEGLPEDHGPVRTLEVEVELRSSCAATLESLEFNGDALEVDSATVADDGSSALLLASGETPELRDLPVVANVAARRPGTVTVDVTSAEVGYARIDDGSGSTDSGENDTDETTTATDSTTATNSTRTTDSTTATNSTDGSSQTADAVAATAPPELVQLTGTYASVPVRGEGPAPPPQNLRIAWQQSFPPTFRWDWWEGLCADDLSHFEVVVEAGGEVREATVPAGRASYEPEIGGAGDPVLLQVRAVEADGRTSEPAWTEALPLVADPTHSVAVGDAPALEVDATTSVPVEYSLGLGRAAPIFEYDLEVAVAAPCVATIEGATTPREDWQVVDSQVAADGTSMQCTVAGSPVGESAPNPVDVEVAGVEPGETMLVVREATARYFAKDSPVANPTYEEYVRLRDRAEGEQSGDVEPDDLVGGEIEPATVGAPVTVEWGTTPPAPSDLRVDWQVSQRAGLTWDWPGDPCAAGDDAHFRVAIRGDEASTERTVPLGAPTTEVDVAGSEPVEVGVAAVDGRGRTSERVWTELLPSFADPAYTLRGSEPPSLAPGESGTVRFDLSRVLGDGTGLVRYELSASVRTPCVATIEDVGVPAGIDATVVEQSVAPDGSAASVAVECAVADLGDAEILRVHLRGVDRGTTSLTVDDERLEVVESPTTVEDYRTFRADPAELPAETSLDDLTESSHATAVPTTVTVDGPTSIVGDAYPTDPDDDGLYEDVDGDGRFGHADVQAFFSVQHRPASKRPEYFDFNGNDAVGHGDVVGLFEEVASRPVDGS